MSALLITFLAIAALIAGYIFYSKKVKNWVGLDENEITPAVEINDGIDYVPAKHWSILFGHHFASIAGAANQLIASIVLIVVSVYLLSRKHNFISTAFRQ